MNNIPPSDGSNAIDWCPKKDALEEIDASSLLTEQAIATAFEFAPDLEREIVAKMLESRRSSLFLVLLVVDDSSSMWNQHNKVVAGLNQFLDNLSHSKYTGNTMVAVRYFGKDEFVLPPTLVRQAPRFSVPGAGGSLIYLANGNGTPWQKASVVSVGLVAQIMGALLKEAINIKAFVGVLVHSDSSQNLHEACPTPHQTRDLLSCYDAARECTWRALPIGKHAVDLLKVAELPEHLIRSPGDVETLLESFSRLVLQEISGKKYHE